MSPHTERRAERLNADDGMTVIELVTAATIMLIAMSVIGGFIVSVGNAVQTMTDKIDVTQQGRIAQDRLAREIRMAQSPDTTAATPAGRAPVTISRTSATMYLLDRSADLTSSTQATMTKVQWSVNTTTQELVRTTWAMSPVTGGTGASQKWTLTSTTPTSTATVARYVVNGAAAPLFADATVVDATTAPAGGTPVCNVSNAAGSTEAAPSGSGVFVCLTLDRDTTKLPSAISFTTRVVLRNVTTNNGMPTQMPARADVAINAALSATQPSGGYSPTLGIGVVGTVTGAPNTTYQVQSSTFPNTWVCNPVAACTTSGTEKWIATNVTLGAAGAATATTVTLTAPTQPGCSWFRIGLRVTSVNGATAGNFPLAVATPLSGYWTCGVTGGQNAVPSGGIRVDGATARGAYA